MSVAILASIPPGQTIWCRECHRRRPAHHFVSKKTKGMHRTCVSCRKAKRHVKPKHSQTYPPPPPVPKVEGRRVWEGLEETEVSTKDVRQEVTEENKQY